MGLDEELRKTLDDINLQIGVLQGIAARNRVKPEELQDKYGNFLMMPILAAKGNLLAAMVERESQKPVQHKYLSGRDG